MCDETAAYPGYTLSHDSMIHAASANQMLTGSLILFAAVLSRWILGRRLNKLHYMGCASWYTCLMHAVPLQSSRRKASQRCRIRQDNGAVLKV